MVSVVIPAFNEGKNIAAVLMSLVKQKYTKKFEVILVDNNSSDNTVKIAKKFLKKLPLKIVSEKKQGRGAAKARGAKEAKGEILAYMDADTMAYDNWLSTIESAFKNKETIAITGPWRVYDLPDSNLKWFLNNFQEVGYQHPVKLLLGHFSLNGMNMAIRTSAYKKAGGINPELNLHDDFDLAKRLYKLGNIKYVPQMLVETSGRRYKKGLVNGLMSYHKNTLNYLQKRHADLEDIR